MFKIVFYQDKDGNSEIAEYLKILDKNHDKDSKIRLKKINLYIELLAEYGFQLSEPHIKKLDDIIWELRPLNDRILFVHWDGNRFLLLSHFIKKTQKTPKSEIDKAKRLLEDYKRRSE